MQIDLPQDVIDRLKRRTATGQGVSDADVIRKALDSLDWQDQERLAIREGIDALNDGRMWDFEEFDRVSRDDNSI